MAPEMEHSDSVAIEGEQQPSNLEETPQIWEGRGQKPISGLSSFSIASGALLVKVDTLM